MTQENGLANTPMWEKLFGLLGLALIVITIVFLLWSATTQDDERPYFEFTVNETLALGSRFLVLLDVRNTGDLTVSDLGVEATLSAPDGSTESAEVRIDYLAAGSTRRVGVYFDTDPGGGNLEVRALGYQDP